MKTGLFANDQYNTLANTPDSRPYDEYQSLLNEIIGSFTRYVNNGKEPVFETSACNTDLFQTFLYNLPEEARQHYNCNACRNFVNRYGGLVVLGDDGSKHSIMWAFKGPIFFQNAVRTMRNIVANSKVTGAFITSEKRLGIPKTGIWTHMAVEVPKGMQYKNSLKTAHQAACEKDEDFKLLMNALNKYSTETIKTAVNLLRSNTLARGVKFVDQAEWLLDLRKRRGEKNLWDFANIVRKKSYTAPSGFCHISGSVLGSLLDDIQDGLDVNTIKHKFDDKVDPLKYHRPQVAPGAANVKRAEEIVAKLGLANSLKRRFATMNDIQTVWRPTDKEIESMYPNIFAYVKIKEPYYFLKNDISPRDVTMTWEKFQRTVLPNARKIEMYVGSGRHAFSALVTAADYDAPPIISWDSEENRNPVSWYLYHGGSYSYDWGVGSSQYVEVTGIALQPSMWQPGYDRFGKSVFFLLKDCKDRNNNSICLFPEILRGELHEVRATIEAYSKTEKLSGVDQANACGIVLSDGRGDWNYKFRVTTDVGVSTYILDRWD